MSYTRFLVVPALVALGMMLPAAALAWRSNLYEGDWVPPEQLGEALSFETDRIIQDFSYAGYHRGEIPIPEVDGPVFDVSDFGADSTGSADSTTAIQEAIDAAAAAGGGVVRLPAGTFRIRPQGSNNWSLRIRDSGIVLRGAGPTETFLYNDSWEMRGKTILRVDRDSGWGDVPSGSPMPSIRSDLLGPTTRIPVDDVSGFDEGDWVVVRADATEEFKAEHNMEDVWGGQDIGPGVLFIRRIEAIDASTDTLTIDVPTRYYLKTRDNARVHMAGSFLEEVGLEGFSIGNIEHPNSNESSGWDTREFNEPGTNAYDVHGANAIRLRRVRNAWIRDVETYRPPANTLNAHVLSNGLTLLETVAVTVQSSHFQRALYGGGGGNAYMLRMLNAQETLVQDTSVGFNRHGFVFQLLGTSGNVIHGGLAERTGNRAVAGGAGSNGSDHHMWLSQSNLVDGVQLDGDYFAAFYRSTTGSNHGMTATHSVYWNLEGLSYFGSRDYIVNSQQGRYGYVIGTRGPAPGVSTGGLSAYERQSWRTDPIDHVEGEGEGDTLEPRSLYLDQLERRLADAPSMSAAMPRFMPRGGTHFGPVSVSLSSTTPGAEIFYTIDDSAPSTDSTPYTGELRIDTSGTVRARAYAAGLEPSAVASEEFVIVEECLEVRDDWENAPLPSEMEMSELEFEGTPAGDEVNSVLGLSSGPASSYTDLAAIVRFNPDGWIDARDGDEYRADREIPYAGGTGYVFRLSVDVAAGVYDAFVTPAGGEERTIGTAMRFRSEQADVLSLDNFGTFSSSGGHGVCDLTTVGDDADRADAGVGGTDAGAGGSAGPPSASGCGCTTGGRGGAQVWPLLLLALVIRRSTAPAAAREE